MALTKSEVDMRAPKVNIRPGVSVLAILKYLNYRAWFALAEFVDNSIQSYLANKSSLEKIEGSDFILKIRIDINANGCLTIRDNAFGIPLADFPRAFRPAAIPPDRSGLSEFGMGMKSAACWFSPHASRACLPAVRASSICERHRTESRTGFGPVSRWRSCTFYSGSAFFR